MKRELKLITSLDRGTGATLDSDHIPMKRELKLFLVAFRSISRQG